MISVFFNEPPTPVKKPTLPRRPFYRRPQLQTFSAYATPHALRKPFGVPASSESPTVSRETPSQDNTASRQYGATDAADEWRQVSNQNFVQTGK
jgi:hypothetical protein